MAKVKSTTIKDVHFDNMNINKGSEFGTSLLGRSIEETGMGRSVLLDKNNVLIAGNKTVEAAAALGIEKMTIIETVGDEIIAVKRTDLDINTERGIKAKILDNTVSAHNYVEDEEMVEALVQEAGIMNLNTYGLKSPDDEDGRRVSFNASNKHQIKIEFTSSSDLEAAEKDINNLLRNRYPDAIITTKGK